MNGKSISSICVKFDTNNFLLMHAVAPNVFGVIGSAIAAGILWSVLAG